MKFPEKFIWGAASAAYQVEGAYLDDGKGLNIWDAYCQEPGKIAHGENGNVSCDHYHRFREDVKLMAETGIKYYRFSINWSRVIPDGTGAVNEKGLKFYSDLVDELLANGIQPMVTLFHWDYPYALHKKGGWLNDESSEWFAEYAEVIVNALSDRVKYWMTINEPQVFIGLGYDLGRFAPFEKHNARDLAQMSHNVLLAHGKAVGIIREKAVTEPVIGFAYATSSYSPTDDSPEAVEKAKMRTFAFDRNTFSLGFSWWADPVFLGDYPADAYSQLGDDMPRIKPGDMEIISRPIDFFGLNVYESKAVSDPLGYAENAYIGCPRTSMEWPVTPETMYWSVKFINERYNKPVLITENGMACCDWVHLDGKVHDPQRIDFMKRYLRELNRAVSDGADVMGYIYWSIMDNFEWADGYDKRFGLVYVDYRTQERTVKDSAYWYREVIRSGGEILAD
ncbi:MAG: GH1 family beta-glucosidase [Oscillospiraceae bacterium]|nr:GH1 family beta-glucosidase [Oscillospiraceae bacterium]